MTGSLLGPLRAADHRDVVALNERHVHLTAPMDVDRLLHLDTVGTVEVIRAEGRFAGFVVTMAGDADYDSGNFGWFAERYDSFCYLDRIVVHEDFRRRGLAGRVYDEVEARDGAYGRRAGPRGQQRPAQRGLARLPRRPRLRAGR